MGQWKTIYGINDFIMKNHLCKSQHEKGAKLDSGKPLAGTVILGFKEALAEVVKVGTFGAHKYTKNGWQEVEDGEDRYTEALFRHLLASEEIDEESGQLHAAMAIWNMLAVLTFKLQKKKS